MKPAAATCAEIEEKLFAAKRRLNSVLEDSAWDFTMARLGESELPERCFAVLLQVLTNNRFRRCGALADWLIVVVVNADMLTQEQKATLLDVLMENHCKYEREVARYAVGDAIASTYGPAEVVATIKKLLAKNHPRSRYVALATAETLLRELEPGHPLRQTVKDLYRAA